jgi:predicted nucleotidyltransferase
MTYTFTPAYPTREHARAAERITRFFSAREGVDAVLLTCSCARGKATRDSCLDIAVLVRPERVADRRAELDAAWGREYAGQSVYADLKAAGLYSHVDLEITAAQFQPGGHGWTTGADEFELEIGNLLVYSAPLWQGGGYWDELRARWLPYYGAEMRGERLEMVRGFFANNLGHIPPYVARGLFFQAFNRLYCAFGEFLQALFIQQRVYPIAYDKWVREQVAEILELPELYARLPRLFEIRQFESGEIAGKAGQLKELFDEYIRA